MSASASHQSVQELTESFHAFTSISKDLELAYDRLRDQAARIDVALAESNRKLQEKVEELDETSRHLQAILEGMCEAVVVCDRDGRITLVNRAFEELTGRSAQDLHGRRKGDLTDDCGHPICAPSSASPRTLRTLSFGSADPRILRSSLSSILGQDGEPIATVETLVEETELEVLRQELRQRETLSALGEMAAGIAHELRNPMVAIEGFAHLLHRSVDDGQEACRAHSTRIIQGVRKANSIITNLLCFARPDKFRPRRTRLLALFHSLRLAYADQRSPGARVEVDSPQPAQLEVRCDPALLERMLINLIDNARTAAGGDGMVRVTAALDGEAVVLHVSDDGPGVPAELRDRLFLPFVTGRPDGTGLGLAIVHRIVDLHQGRIEVRERPGGGALIAVHLPVRPAGQRGSFALPGQKTAKEGVA